MIVKTVDNFFGEAIWKETSKQIEKNQRTGYICEIDKHYKDSLSVTLRDYTDAKLTNNVFFSFFKDKEKIQVKNSDDLIISVQKTSEEYRAQSGNYVGKFIWNGLTIDIRSRFSDQFLQRMLNFVNNVYLDDVSVFPASLSEKVDFSKYFIYYLYVQTLEKAFLLGLPKAYKSIQHHEMKLKGKIDINRFIKSDIPFKGKISSTSREQHEIQEIIDTLYKAVKVIDKSGKGFTQSISHIKAHLKQYRSNSYVSNTTINKAMESKALQNPIFMPYKKVLEYARFIINGNNLEENKNGNSEAYGFLVNVAELFEIYVTKLLTKEFPDWTVKSPKLEVYPNHFFARKIIPDIVMTHKYNAKNVMVFDTKYKRMFMRNRYQSGGDLDRNDFFQINTYMSYYQQNGYSVIVGGLLYPMENFSIDHAHADNWLCNVNSKFIIDGINLSTINKNDTIKQIIDGIISEEKNFINRIRKLIK
jgi:5-methylcytosine-specific restriction endonuclease McrBC regulatory subunit McrC